MLMILQLRSLDWTCVQYTYIYTLVQKTGITLNLSMSPHVAHNTSHYRITTNSFYDNPTHINSGEISIPDRSSILSEVLASTGPAPRSNHSSTGRSNRFSEFRSFFSRRWKGIRRRTQHYGSRLFSMIRDAEILQTVILVLDDTMSLIENE